MGIAKVTGNPCSCGESPISTFNQQQKKPKQKKQKKSDKITYDGEKLPNLRLVSSFLNENHLSWKTQALLRKYLKKQCFCMDNVDNVNQVNTVFFCIQHHQVT